MKILFYKGLSNLISLLKLRSNIKNQNVILLFHSIIDRGSISKNIYELNTETFEKLIKFLIANFNFESFDNCFSGCGKIILTFDDGYLNNLKNAYPILAENNIPFHLFAATDLIESGDSKYLNKNQLKELSSYKNVSIGSHGKSHNKLTKISQNNLKKELDFSKKYLEDLTNKTINTISFPHGAYNERVINEIKNKNFSKAASSIFGLVNSETNNFLLPRIDVWSTDTNKILLQKINGYWNWMNLINKMKRK